ncbi:MAG: DUF3883 domain-containing protein, partial [Clostridia bacterium]
ELIAMAAVEAAERALGYTPRDVSRDRVGYDIESGRSGHPLRFLEVKGRQTGAETVTVTANELRTALNRPEQFILALVEVAETGPVVRYVRQPFAQAPDFGVDSVNYRWRDLWQRGTEPV